MGSVVFTWGPFEVELGARPITIVYPHALLLDEVKIINQKVKVISREQNKHDETVAW